jgi:hypothetical protein
MIGPETVGQPPMGTESRQVLMQYTDRGPPRDADIYPDDISRIGINSCVYFYPDRLQLHVPVDRPDKIRPGYYVSTTMSLHILKPPLNGIRGYALIQGEEAVAKTVRFAELT